MPRQKPYLAHRNRLAFIALGCALGLLPLGGCERAESIQSYTVAKPPPAVRPDRAREPSAPAANDDGNRSQTGQPGAMLGAIVPHGEQTWFFKLLGPQEPASRQAAPFLTFMQSVRFEGDRPRWQLPEGWTERPGNAFRFATIEIGDGETPLELSVTTLPTGGQELNEYLLSNINRWRGQLRLAPIEAGELETRTIKLEVDGHVAWLVNMQGTMTDDGMARPSREASPPVANASETSRPLPFNFVLPEGWKQQPAGPMRLAQFEASQGPRHATVSVSTAGGEVVANVNRWRDQVKLPPLEAQQVRDSIRQLEAGPLTADYVELFSPESATPREAILGAILTAQGRQWFIKLQGDAELAREEQARFEAFVRSIRFADERGRPDAP